MPKPIESLAGADATAFRSAIQPHVTAVLDFESFGALQTQIDLARGVLVSNFAALEPSSQTERIDVAGSSALGVGMGPWVKDTDQIGTTEKAWRKRMGATGPFFIIPPDTLNIDRMGADPTGVADSLPIFQEALEYAARARVISGRQRNLPIELGRGVYRTSGEIEVTGEDGAFIGPGAQLCAIVNEATTGHVIKYTGSGDFRFQGFAIDAAGARLAAAMAAGDLIADGFCSDPNVVVDGVTTVRTSIRLTLRDIYVFNQPGTGIMLVQPEGARLENVVGNSNKRHGCRLWGRDVENIENLIDFARFRNNGLRGLDVDFMSINMFNRVEALNNADPIQFRLYGYNNIVNQPDVECFDLVTGGTSYIGLQIEGNGNIVNAGTYYALNQGIRLSGAAKNTVIKNPKMEGKSGIAMTNGVNVTNGCLNNEISFGTLNNVTTPLLDAGTGTQDNILGMQRLNKYGLRLPDAATLVTASSTQILDLSLQSTFWFNLKDFATFQATNLAAGRRFTLIVQIDAAPNSGRGFTFNSQFKQAVTGNGGGVPVANTYTIMEFVCMGTASIRQIGKNEWAAL